MIAYEAVECKFTAQCDECGKMILVMDGVNEATEEEYKRAVRLLKRRTWQVVGKHCYHGACYKTLRATQYYQAFNAIDIDNIFVPSNWTEISETEYNNKGGVLAVKKVWENSGIIQLTITTSPELPQRSIFFGMPPQTLITQRNSWDVSSVCEAVKRCCQMWERMNGVSCVSCVS